MRALKLIYFMFCAGVGSVALGLPYIFLIDFWAYRSCSGTLGLK